MWVISDDDAGKISQEITRVIVQLGDGNKKVERLVNLGEDIPLLTVLGYWVGNLIRVDVKIEK